MGKRRYKKRKHMREDYESIQSAGKKRGLWGSIGATLIGGLAMLATGGAAAPLVAGMMAAGGSFAGGHIGNWLAGKTKGGKLTGTKWYQSLGKDLGSQIKEGINVRALKSGFNTMLMAGGGKITSKILGKGGTTVTAAPGATAGTNKLGEYTKGLFKGGDKGTQTGFKSLIDYEGSAMGGFFENMAAKKVAAEELTTMRGFQGEYEALQTSQKADASRTALGKAPSFDEMMSGPIEGPGFKKGILPGHSKVQYDVAQAKSAEISAGLKDYQFSAFPEGIQEPIQESLFGGVDPNPRGSFDYSELGSPLMHPRRSNTEKLSSWKTKLFGD